MVRKVVRLVAVVLATVSFGVVVTPACVIKLGKGTGPDETEGAGGSDTGGDEGGATGGTGAGGSSLEEEIQMGEEAYAQLPPEELAFASARAGHYTCALSGAIDSAVQLEGLDPATLDEEAILALLDQYAPGALEQAEAWLEGVDPSTLAYTVIPKFECETDYGCKYSSPCQQGHIPSVKHRCFVDDCGKSKCRTCPDIVNTLLQNIVIKAWCSYVCVETGTSPPKVVAVGAGGVSALKNIFFGPICVSYP